MKKAWGRWKSFAEVVGNFQATIIFSALFYALVIPFGFFYNIFQKPDSSPNWSNFSSRAKNLKTAKEQ